MWNIQNLNINYWMFIEDTHCSLTMTGGWYSRSRGGAAEDVIRLPLHSDPGEVQTRGQLHRGQETTHCRFTVYNKVQSHLLPLHSDPGEVQTRGQLHRRQETTHCRCIVFNVVQSHFDTLSTLSDSLYTLTQEKSKLEASYIADKKHFIVGLQWIT